MILKCEKCQTQYELADKDQPTRSMRLRCPVCSAIFNYHPSIPGKANTESNQLWLSRLAHALISDIEVYNVDRLLLARKNDTVLTEFAREIQQAWTEFKTRSGQSNTTSRLIFTETLNEILGQGATLI